MLINRVGASMVIEGKTYTVGMPICGTPESEYDGLYGRILAIADGKDKETENETVDITCEFYPPENELMINRIEEVFSDLYDEVKKIEDICLDYVIMAPDMIRPVKKCRIYQIEPMDQHFVFRGYEAIQRAGLQSPPAELYKLVYDGQLETDSLEDIFRIFNTDYPAGYTGRSLSMSDIAELYDEDGSNFFYCNTVGFVEVSFKPIAAE